jgi:hypothetical protein
MPVKNMMQTIKNALLKNDHYDKFKSILDLISSVLFDGQ